MIDNDQRPSHETAARDWLEAVFRYWNTAADNYLRPLNRLGEFEVGNRFPVVEVRKAARAVTPAGVTQFVAMTYVAGTRVIAVSEHYHSPRFDAHDLDIDLTFELVDGTLRLEAFPTASSGEIAQLLWDEFVWRDQQR